MNRKLSFVVLLAIAMTYIAYEAPFAPNYESNTAVLKQAFIWNKALADNGTPSQFAGTLELAQLVAPVFLGGQDFTPVGHNNSDQNAYGRKKLIHSVSKSAKVVFNFSANPYTGAFAESSCIGIMRASSATPPTTSNTAPGMGIKIFRDKVPSGNFVAMYDLFGQDNDTNFFSHAFSNHVSDLVFKFSPQFLPLKLLGNKFAKFDANINMVGLSDLAQYKNDGTHISSPKAPFALVFKPNPLLKTECQGAHLAGENFGCLDQIAPGTLLYTIYYVENPVAKKDVTTDTLKYLGTMTSASEFVSSKFMDEVVQFKHVFWADEIKALGNTSWNSKITKEFAQEDGAPKWEAVLEQMK